MRHFYIFIVFAIVILLHPAAEASAIDDVIAAQMPASRAPGLAYAVVEDGRIRAGATGETLIGSGRRVTPDTPFLLGSISKGFTALAVMQLVEAGRVDLDGRISQYLGAFANRPPGAITVRQLLSHTSGYSTVQGNDTHTDRSGGNDELSRQVDRVAQWTPAYPPGVRWEYSNANYQILGMLVETVSGEDYARYVETHILEPLGMDHSFVSDGQRYDSMATPHRPWFGTKRPLTDIRTNRVMAPAGGVVASARDVARYMAAMMNGKDDILSARGKALMLRPAGAASPFYGLGWFVDTGNSTVYHSGSTPGVETLATLAPDRRAGVVVLVNAGSGIGFGETAALRNGITAKALGLDDVDEGSRWQQKALFIGLVLLPPGFLLSMAWAWTHREALRAKRSSRFGLFSLWFPLAATIAMAVLLLFVVPPLFGGSLRTLRLFQPDLALTFVASAITGVAWAAFRLWLSRGHQIGASGRPPA